MQWSASTILFDRRNIALLWLRLTFIKLAMWMKAVCADTKYDGHVVASDVQNVE